MSSPLPYLQDRYRLTQRLREGSMGVVYQAQDGAFASVCDRPSQYHRLRGTESGRTDVSAVLNLQNGYGS